ncbi:MAG: hypothetical protein ACRDGH_05900 [Candidatus Limnocylindria bacterium]
MLCDAAVALREPLGGTFQQSNDQHVDARSLPGADKDPDSKDRGSYVEEHR